MQCRGWPGLRQGLAQLDTISMALTALALLPAEALLLASVVVGLISAGLVCKSTRHDRDIARCVGIMHHAMHLVQWHDRGQGGWWRQWNAWGVAVLRMPDPEADSTVEGAAKGPAEAEGRGGGLARMLTSPWNTSDEVELAAACSTQKDVCWI